MRARRRTSFSYLIVVLAIGGGGDTAALAQCEFDAPAKAKGMKASLVRVHVACPSTTFPAPNTTTSDGLPACSPLPISLYEFDDEKASCSLRTKHGVKTPCPDGLASSCSDLRITVKCTGIRDPGGATLTGTPNWTLTLMTRTTISDASNGDMTIVDHPSQLTLPDAVNGSLKATFEVGPCTGPLCPLFGPSGALPPCTHIDVRRVTLNDPDGNAFARIGLRGR